MIDIFQINETKPEEEQLAPFEQPQEEEEAQIVEEKAEPAPVEVVSDDFPGQLYFTALPYISYPTLCTFTCSLTTVPFLLCYPSYLFVRKIKPKMIKVDETTAESTDTGPVSKDGREEVEAAASEKNQQSSADETETPVRIRRCCVPKNQR